MSNNTRRRKTPAAARIGTGGAVAIVVVGIFVLCVIVVLAKAVFSSNTTKVPDGLDTATINTDEPSAAPVDTSIVSNESVVVSESGVSAESSAETESKAADESNSTQILDVMYITEYSYLHPEPSEESENIVCMSPGVEVNVLEYEDNGYVKITFQNIDGPLTGYIYNDYLTASP